MLARWTRLQEIDPIKAGMHEAKARYQEELKHALDEKMITELQYARMVNWNHPSYRERTGPACHQPITRIDYDPDTGRHVWGNCSNDGGPGTNWVGGNTRRPEWHSGMNYLEAQLYNM
jgi:hypothetical protein